VAAITIEQLQEVKDEPVIFFRTSPPGPSRATSLRRRTQLPPVVLSPDHDPLWDVAFEPLLGQEVASQLIDP
jgi:hypothetical protein